MAVVSEALYTEFAPAERFPHEDIDRQAALFRDPALVQALDAVNSLVMILNGLRQIVFTNRNLRELVGLEDERSILGLRPGELLLCENATVLPGGCGTCERCRYCGAARVVLESLGGRPTQEECRIARRTPRGVEAFDLRAKGTPLLIGKVPFSIVAMDDISHEKRRRAMERIFFHDVLNTAGGLSSLVELLGEEAPEPLKPEFDLVSRYFATLLDEIKGQRLLLAAENDEVTLQFKRLDSLALLREVQSFHAAHPLAEGRRIELDAQAQPLSFRSDPTLLKRVLGNMIKNALEATHPGESVTLHCFPAPLPAASAGETDGLAFQVRNPGTIPRPVQMQIFQRSFSTKGQGRGLGTWSIRLLAERYLKGTVSFRSDPETGTAFTVVLPVQE